MTDAPDGQNPNGQNPNAPAGGPGGADGAGDAAAQNAPQLSVLGQYVKDLSFENPAAPNINPNVQPQLSLNLSVLVAGLGPNDYEVTLRIHSEAKAESKPVFILELDYAAVFRLLNIPQEAVHPTLHVECPRIIFPFARRLVADLTKEGGLPPLYVDPVDFGQLYMAQMRRAQEQQAAQGEAPPAASIN